MTALKNHASSRLGGILLGCASLLLTACGGRKDATDKDKQQNTPTPVTLQVAQVEPAVYYDEYPGTATALSQVDLRAQVNGYITGIFFKEGDRVRKGQKLYEIDRRKYQDAVLQAQAALAQSRANQDRAQKDADRYVYLQKQDAIAKQIVDHALTDLATAKAGVANAAAVLNTTRTDLNFATITAPFDGTIGLSQVKLGTLVAASQTLLNTISSDNPMAVDFVVNEKELPRFVRLEQQGAGLPGDSLFTLRLADGTRYDATGRISVIDRAVDPQTGTIRIRLIFPNTEGILRSGMSCTVRVHSQDGSQQLLIPNRATTEQMGEYFVFVAKDTTAAPASSDAKGDKQTPAGPQLVAKQRKVLLGRVIGPNVIVKSGIEPGDRIVVDGLQKLRDGGPITTAVPKQSGAGAAH